MSGDGSEVVTVRIARKDDLPELVAALGQPHYFAHRLRRQPALGVVLVATKDDTVVLGSAFLRLAAAEEWELRQHLPRVPVLGHVEVAPEQRNNGVGTMIVRAAEEEALRRGRHRIALGVTLGNHSGLGYYTRLGYADWGRGPVNAMVETFTGDGTRVFGTERCDILVKTLGTPKIRR